MPRLLFTIISALVARIITIDSIISIDGIITVLTVLLAQYYERPAASVPGGLFGIIIITIIIIIIMIIVVVVVVITVMIIILNFVIRVAGGKRAGRALWNINISKYQNCDL